jgi:hypothetical protein
MHDQLTLDGGPPTPPRKRGKTTTAEEAALNQRAGAVTDAWSRTQTTIRPSDRKRASVFAVVKRALQAGAVPEDRLRALVVDMGGRGVPVSDDSLHREAAAGQNGHRRTAPGRHQPHRSPDQSAYERGPSRARR